MKLVSIVLALLMVTAGCATTYQPTPPVGQEPRAAKCLEEARRTAGHGPMLAWSKVDTWAMLVPSFQNPTGPLLPAIAEAMGPSKRAQWVREGYEECMNRPMVFTMPDRDEHLTVRR